jgi:hypothetical protein
MSHPIHLHLYPGTFAAEDTLLIESVIDGLMALPGKLPDALLSSVAIDVLDETLREIDTTPFVLMEGFVEYAKKFHARYPDFVFFANIDNLFFRDVLIAISGDVRAVRRGRVGVVSLADPENYQRIVQAEITRFDDFCKARCATGDDVRDIHLGDLAEYLSIEAL